MNNVNYSMNDRKRYDGKKREASKRKIPFEITIEQYIRLHEMLSKGLVKCFYTDSNFVHRKDHQNSATLERLCDRMPYRIDNVVWVTKKSNEIKDSVFDKKSRKISSLNESELYISKLIKKSFNNIEKRESTRDFYIKYCCSGCELDKFEITHILSDITELVDQKITEDVSEPPFVCNDIEISRLYQDFYSANKNFDFDLSFGDFKKLITAEHCALTGDRIYSTDDAMIFIKTNTLPINISNCVTTTKETYAACLELINKIGVKKSIKAITSLHNIFNSNESDNVKDTVTVEEIGTPLSIAIKNHINSGGCDFHEGDSVFIMSPKKKSHGAICKFNKYTLSGESLTASLTREDGVTINSSIKDIRFFSKEAYQCVNITSKCDESNSVSVKKIA